MMIAKTTTLLSFLLAFLPSLALAEDFRITPDTELKSVLKQVGAGDSIVLANGTWEDPEFKFEGLLGTEAQPIHIRAESPGKVVLSGNVQFRVSGRHVIVSGFSFLNPVGKTDVFEFRTHSKRHAHHCRITDCSFEQTVPGTKEKSLWMNVYGTNNRVDHCYFAGKRNRGTTLVVWVGKGPGAHRIDHNHFGPRPELGGNGGETIRIGTSEVSESVSQTIVEENYFERCDGEGEIVSNKSCENIYRYNLFDRCAGALTLRHGHRCLVDGNVFLGHEEKGTGGVRIIGSDHRVTNNYFEGLRGDAERAAVALMNGILDSPLNGYAPVRNALIAHNTFIDCKVSMEFGVSASKKISVAPSACQVSHNAFLPGKWELFRIQGKPESFTWKANKYQPGKGRGAKLVEIERVEMKLSRSPAGILRPSDSKALETKELSEIKTDIDGEVRRSPLAGCDDPATPSKNRKTAASAGPSWRGTSHSVTSADEVGALLKSGKLAPGDTIVWADGEYTDEELKLDGVHGTETKPITLRAATPGGVVLRGESRFSIGVQWWVINGFHFAGRKGEANSYNTVQFRGRGNVGAQHVCLQNCAMTQLLAEDESSKWVQLYGRHNTIERCHFRGKASKGALITVELAALKDDETAGHRISGNHFSEFAFQEGTDNEVIRVGNSRDQHKPATCLIERNYFFRCSGENEIISNKSSYNIYRSNTFRECNGALVLRHGHHARVEGNFFFGDGAKDAGGIRVTDSHHVIVNNYMQDLTGTTWNSAFSILGGKKASGKVSNGYQAVDGIVVAHNSIINCARSIFLNKAKGSRAPTGLIANNLVHGKTAPLIVSELPAGKLKWTGNLFHGAPVDASFAGVTADPGLKEAQGLWRPDAAGAAIDAAAEIPLEIETDIEGQKRPKTGKDIGADEVNNSKALGSLAPLKPEEVGAAFLRQKSKKPTGTSP